MPRGRIEKVKKEVEECTEESKLMEKIKSDFVERREIAMISLEEGNLARTEQTELHNDPMEDKKPKICSTCVSAKVI
jgi:hypothetical protein